MTYPPSEFAAEILRRPRAVIGTGTQGRRIALMLASQGGEVRIYGLTICDISVPRLK